MALPTVGTRNLVKHLEEDEEKGDWLLMQPTLFLSPFQFFSFPTIEIL